ncbi:hypothetical protein CH366_15915 [Leptospira harrisiae]|uniref:Uncharacterized protein n=1 Tax=Leptospira harrisiae TaxID=2023189 RepID=A0A2N0AIW1_9LEPT|nr:hypothetical protein CH364_13040 [Leptospira harrisiae]PKA07838.1 hypothetical protein CH366_15915 [Leptospira harrisiae]
MNSYPHQFWMEKSDLPTNESPVNDHSFLNFSKGSRTKILEYLKLKWEHLGLRFRFERSFFGRF